MPDAKYRSGRVGLTRYDTLRCLLHREDFAAGCAFRLDAWGQSGIKVFYSQCKETKMQKISLNELP